MYRNTWQNYAWIALNWATLDSALFSIAIRLHLLKMQAQLAVHLDQMGLAQSIQVEFLYLPSYSPKLKGVEYVIHLLRLRFLHHLPIGTTLAQIEQKLNQFLDSNQFLSAEQVQKTLNFIFSLVS